MDFAAIMNQLGEPLTIGLGALIIGAAFGGLAQRSALCLRSAVMEFAELKSGLPGSGWGQSLGLFALAYGSAMALTQGLIAFGGLEVETARQLVSARSVSGPLIGGLVLGAGMVLTRGCPGRLLVLSGNGNLRAVFSLAVFAAVAYAAYGGPLAPLKITAAGLLKLSPGAELNLAAAAGLGPAAGAAIGGLIAVLSLVCLPALRARPRAGLAATGAGLMIAVGWWFTYALSSQAFEPIALESINFTKSSVELASLFAHGLVGQDLTFGVGLMAGVLAGSAVAGFIAREIKLRWFADWAAIARYSLGAAAKGFGGVLAGGCAIGAGLTGNAIFAAGPMLALVAMVGGALLMKAFLASLEGVCVPVIAPCEEAGGVAASK